MAVRNGHADVVAWLIGAADPAVVRAVIVQILVLCGRSATIEGVEILRPFMEDVNDLTPAIEAAASARNVALAKWLIEIQVARNPSVSFRGAVLEAIRAADLEIPHYIQSLGLGMHLGAVDTTVSHAVRMGFLDGLRYLFGLMDDGERIVVSARAMEVAIGAHETEMATFLMSFAEKSTQSLILAVKSQCVELVQSILAYDSSSDFVNRLTPDGTPLTVAARIGNSEIVSLLLSLPTIDLDAANELGDSPLVIASSFKHVDVMRLIVAGMADLSIPTR
jgi:hypothetical protein